MKEYEFKSGLLDRKRKLILSEYYVEYESNDLKANGSTRMDKADIIDFKHGMDWIVWYKFIVGQQFSITFKNKENKELKILFKRYFGMNDEYNQMYSLMVDDIWQYYHQDIVNKYLDRFYNDEALSIQGLKLSQKGIELRNQSSMVPWHKISIKEYVRYFAIFNKDNPVDHSRVSYNEYETEILWSMIKTILKE